MATDGPDGDLDEAGVDVSHKARSLSQDGSCPWKPSRRRG